MAMAATTIKVNNVFKDGDYCDRYSSRIRIMEPGRNELGCIYLLCFQLYKAEDKT